MEKRTHIYKNVIDESKTEPKLIYRSINDKLKVKNNKSFTDGRSHTWRPQMQTEWMNRCFQSVFSNKSKFEEVEQMRLSVKLEMVEVTINEVKRIIENLDVRKSVEGQCKSKWNF